MGGAPQDQDVDALVGDRVLAQRLRDLAVGVDGPGLVPGQRALGELGADLGGDLLVEFVDACHVRFSFERANGAATGRRASAVRGKAGRRTAREAAARRAALRPAAPAAKGRQAGRLDGEPDRGAVEAPSARLSGAGRPAATASESAFGVAQGVFGTQAVARPGLPVRRWKCYVLRR